MRGDSYLKKYENIDLKYNLRVLWSFLKKYRSTFFWVILIIFAIEINSFIDNFVFKYLIDQAALFTAEQITAALFGKIIVYTVLFFLGLKLIGAYLWYLNINVVNKLESRLMNDIEKKSFWHIITLSYRFHINKKTGSIISQFTRGVNKVESFADAFIFNFVPVVFRMVLSVSVIFYFDAVTAICLIVMTLLFIIAGVYITNKQKLPQNITNYHEDNLKQNLSDVFTNIETVKYFAKEKSTLTYFSKLSAKLRDARYKFWNYFAIFSAIQTIILALGMSAIFYFSFNGFISGRLTMGSIILIYAAVWKLIPQLFGLIHGYRQFIRSSVDVDALFKMFKEKNEVRDARNAKKIDVKNANIEYENVSFAYPKKCKSGSKGCFAIQNLNLKIKKNTKVALVGPSGGGKSTVVKMLYRLFDLDNGKITIDGQDVSKVTQESLRDSMSVVPQEPILFDNTIWFNIAYANPKASRKDIWKAIKFAQLDKFIRRLPDKERTIVGERGVKLSGGEKQRVSIARALLADKKILVLDEATSALDSETEKEIQNDLAKLMKGRTTMIIAHRLSTIMKADIIVVLKGGKIIEQGTHKELTNQQGGLYRRLWMLQQGGELD
jgi:ATP-binding cassette, subfamily B, heavy metal transporter